MNETEITQQAGKWLDSPKPLGATFKKNQV